MLELHGRFLTVLDEVTFGISYVFHVPSSERLADAAVHHDFGQMTRRVIEGVCLVAGSPHDRRRP